MYSGIQYDKNIIQDLIAHADITHRPPCDLSNPKDVERQAALNDLLYKYFATEVNAAGSKVVRPSAPLTEVRLVVENIKVYARAGYDNDAAADFAAKELKAAKDALSKVVGPDWERPRMTGREP